MTLSRWTTAAAATLLATAFAAPAHAQRPPRHPPRPHPQQQGTGGTAAQTTTPPAGDATTVEARRAYDDGRRELEGGQNEAALTHFQHAYELRPNPVVLLPIAEAQQRLGRIPDAIATLERYLHDRADAPDRAAIEARLTELRGRPGTLHVESTPAGAHILLDGHDTGQTTPADVPAPAGHHTVRLEFAGHAPATQETDATPGGRAEVTATLVANAPALPANPTPAVTPPPSVVAPREQPRGTSPAVWVAGSLAGAGLIAGSVFGFLALGDLADFNRMPTVQTRDHGETMALLSDISFGVAVLSASVAVVVFFSDRATPAENRPRPRALLRPGGGTPVRLRAVPNGLALTF